MQLTLAETAPSPFHFTRTAWWRIDNLGHEHGWCPPDTDAAVVNGPFDPTPEDPYPYLYASQSPVPLLQQEPLHARGTYGNLTLPSSRLRDRVALRCSVKGPLNLIDLTGTRLFPGLNARERTFIHPDRFRDTQQLARRLRAQHPDAQGLIWAYPDPKPHSDLRDIVVLFGDRCPTQVMDPFETRQLDSPNFTK